MLMFTVRGPVALPSGGTFSPTSAESTAYLARTTGLDDTHKAIYDAMITGLVADAVWSKFDAIWMTANQDRVNARLNLKSSSFTLIENGSPTFTANRGFNGADASTTIFLDTQLNASTAGGQFAQNTGHVSAWSIDTAVSGASGGEYMGVYDGTSISSGVFGRFNGDLAFFQVNTVGASGVASTDGSGHFLANRTGGSATQGFRNGSTFGAAGSDVSGTMPNGNFYILARNTIGTGATTGSANRIALVTVGGVLTGTEITNSYNRFLTAVTALLAL